MSVDELLDLKRVLAAQFINNFNYNERKCKELEALHNKLDVEIANTLGIDIANLDVSLSYWEDYFAGHPGIDVDPAILSGWIDKLESIKLDYDIIAAREEELNLLDTGNNPFMQIVKLDDGSLLALTT